MKIIIEKAIYRSTLEKNEKLIHRKWVIDFPDTINFIVWSNWSWKSTLLERIADKYNLDIYNENSSKRFKWDCQYETNMISMIQEILSSSWESYFYSLVDFINNSTTDYILIDEPEKSLCLQAQIWLAHLFADKLKEWKKFIIVTHSYILLHFANINNIPVYDFDTKKFSKNYLPKLW